MNLFLNEDTVLNLVVLNVTLRRKVRECLKDLLESSLVHRVFIYTTCLFHSLHDAENLAKRHLVLIFRKS